MVDKSSKPDPNRRFGLHIEDMIDGYLEANGCRRGSAAWRTERRLADEDIFGPTIGNRSSRTDVPVHGYEIDLILERLERWMSRVRAELTKSRRRRWGE